MPYEDLAKKYPLLFENSEDSNTPFAHFGFECNDGWYNIIDGLCKSLYRNYRITNQRLDYVESSLKDLDRYIQYRKDLTKEQALQNLEKEKSELLVELEEAKRDIPMISQIKEKFGTLRFYVDFREGVSACITSRVYALVDFAEHMTELTCEECGNKGETYEMGWHKTLCPIHAMDKYGVEKVAEYHKAKNE